MVRLVGVDLPRNKRIAYALTYIHGIGLTSATGLIPSCRASCRNPVSGNWGFCPIGVLGNILAEYNRAAVHGRVVSEPSNP